MKTTVIKTTEVEIFSSLEHLMCSSNFVPPATIYEMVIILYYCFFGLYPFTFEIMTVQKIRE